jgi:hypothetical protein
MLTNWNFDDEIANSTTPQINRQKSARNLAILEFDPSVPRALFFDVKRDARHTATLTQCDCKDFNYIGNTPRLAFKPCMHIYRLAIELGLIEAKYVDQNTQYRLFGAMAREETERLQQLASGGTQWGGWPSEIHESGMQKTRQFRGYAISQRELDSLRVVEAGWIIHNYNVTLASCDCADYRERKLPCKHIYAGALVSKIALPFTLAEYEAGQRDWKYVPLYLGGRSFTFAEYEATKDKTLQIAFDASGAINLDGQQH